LNKARRGELFTCVPIGYVRSADGGIALDPDEQVRSVVAMVFELFAELGSIPKVQAHLVAHGIRIGMRAYRGPQRGQLVWRPARRSTLYAMLRHPAYAGAYVYGRHACDPTLRAAGRSKSGRRTTSPEEWVCLLKDRIPGYLTWEQFEANGRQLRENDRGRGASRASSGRGPTLLNGLVRCGRCGRPMAARNARPTANPRYVCDALKLEYGGPLCQSTTAAAIDRLIEGLVLRAVEPAALELSLRAAERVELDRQRLHRHWRQRLERAEYEANRARRQYDAVDPENRLVARELERQWEQKLAEHQRLEEDYARFRHEQPRHLTATDRERIRALAADVPALWQGGHDDDGRPPGDRPAVGRAGGGNPPRGDRGDRGGGPLAGRIGEPPRGPSGAAPVRWPRGLCPAEGAGDGASWLRPNRRADRGDAESGGLSHTEGRHVYRPSRAAIVHEIGIGQYSSRCGWPR
jgi:hypothetical protein